MYAVVTGGGTAGHVLPALAVAEALVARGRDPATIQYMGAERGVETRLVPPTPFPYTFHDVTGFQRRLTRENLGFAPRLARATRSTIRQFRSNPPRVVVSVGGYASMPAVFAARRLGIPIVVVSYDRTPGRASQLSARWAAASAVSFENSPLPRATVTGAPVRQEMLAVDRQLGRSEARRALGIPDDRFLIAVMGGSLGSGVLNSAMSTFLRGHIDDRDLAVRQVAGERFVAHVEVLDPASNGVLHQVVGYEAEMPAVYAAADLLVGRGGASTVHEVAVTGVPAILIPWGLSADDHQTENVRWLSEVGGAILLGEADIDELGDHIDALRNDDAARADLSRAALRRGEVHRTGALARLIEDVAVTSPAS